MTGAYPDETRAFQRVEILRRAGIWPGVIRRPDGSCDLHLRPGRGQVVSAAFLLNPARFTWLDRLPAPRMPRWRKRGMRHADALTPPKTPVPGWTGPKHASTGRINCGGLPRTGGPMPRRQPGETRFGSLIDRGPDRAPWLTGEMAVLAGECRVPAQTDADTLRMYRGDYGTMPVERIEGERLASVTLT